VVNLLILVKVSNNYC